MTKVLKSKVSEKRLKQWYQVFLQKATYPFKEDVITTTFGKTHVLFAGDESNPPLICLHAMMTSSAHLLSELGDLPERYFIIAPDIPGQSPMGLPKHLSYSDNSHAQWLNEIFEQLDLDRADLFGVSLGGFIARQFTSLFPHKVQTLTLMVPAGIVQGNAAKGLMNMAVPFIKYKLKPSEENLKNWLESIITIWDDDWGNYMGDSFNDFKFHSKLPPLASDEELQNLKVPILIIAAGKDISFPGKPLIERAQKQIPTVETELIPDSRHCPPTTDAFRNWMANRVDYFIKKQTEN